MIGPYRLVGRLGQGGMGQVFLAMSPGGRPVAVKAIRAELAADPQFRTRFGREVAAARRVSGVFTAMVVDADMEGPVAWLATAYVAGPSLAEAVDRHGPLPEASLLALAAGLAESMHAIHSAGVVHRDLKPSNVLLAEDGPRVIDFGISRAMESTALTQTGLVVGSPGFMSPEQAMGREVGPPSDIFSLGAVLAFAATGQGPFGTGPTATLLYRVVHEMPDLEQVPRTVRPLIKRCLAKNPARRPTADGLLAEVGALQPTGSWLPESIIRTFARDGGSGPEFAQTRAEFPWSGPAPTTTDQEQGPGTPQTQTALGGSVTPVTPVTPASAGESTLLVGAAGSAPGTRGSQPPPSGGSHRKLAPGGRNRPRPRPRLWRPLVLAWALGALILASGATAFALNSFTRHPATTDKQTAQVSSPTPTAGAVPSAAGGPSTGSGPSRGGVSHTAGGSARPSRYASAQATSGSRTSTTSVATSQSSPAPSSTPAATSPAPSSTGGKTPSPGSSSPTPSSAGSTTPPPGSSSPAPSPAGSATPSSSGSATPTSAGSASPAPSPAGSASATAQPTPAST